MQSRVHWHCPADVEQVWFPCLPQFWYSVGGAAGRRFLQHRLVAFPLEVVTRCLLWGRRCLERWWLPWLQRPPSLLNRCQKSWRCIRFAHYLTTSYQHKNQKLDQDYIGISYFIAKDVEELVWSKIRVDSSFVFVNTWCLKCYMSDNYFQERKMKWKRQYRHTENQRKGR